MRFVAGARYCGDNADNKTMLFCRVFVTIIRLAPFASDFEAPVFGNKAHFRFLFLAAGILASARQMTARACALIILRCRPADCFEARAPA